MQQTSYGFAAPIAELSGPPRVVAEKSIHQSKFVKGNTMNRTKYYHRQAARLFSLFVAAILVVSALLATAQQLWVPQTGDWAVASNWSGTLGSNVIIDNGGTATVDFTITLNSNASVTLGDTGGSGAVNMTSGVLDIGPSTGLGAGEFLGKPEYHRRNGHGNLHPIRRRQHSLSASRRVGRDVGLHRASPLAPSLEVMGCTT